MLRAHVQSFLQTLNLVCLLVRFPSFRYPQMNVYVNKCCNDPQKARALRAQKTFKSYLTLYVTFDVVLDEIFNNHFNL